MIISRHAERWAKLSDETKRALELKAKRHMVAKREHIQERIADLRAQRDVLEARVESAATADLPILMSTSAWEPEFVAMYDRLVSSLTFRKASRIEPLRREAIATPLPLAGPALAELQARAV